MVVRRGVVARGGASVLRFTETQKAFGVPVRGDVMGIGDVLGKEHREVQ